jgi:phosphohistidine phosphatase
MRIYLIRHSNAVELGTEHHDDDSQRPLTDEGCEKMEGITSALKGLGMKPDLIVSSPYVRAKQTAEILAKGLKYRKDVEVNEALVPLGEAEVIVAEINEKYLVEELVLVGHEPSLSTLIGTLTAGNPEMEITMKKGGVCCLLADDLRIVRKATLEWLLTPKILSALS